MKRYLAVDFGLKRLGVAVSDGGKTIALPVQMVTAEKNISLTAKKLFTFIQSLDYTVEKIIIGHPLLLDGGKSDMTLTVEEFAEQLETISSIPVELFDERLSSKSIDALLRDVGVNRKKRDQASDMQSACLLLQNYLDKNT